MKVYLLSFYAKANEPQDDDECRDLVFSCSELFLAEGSAQSRATEIAQQHGAEGSLEWTNEPFTDEVMADRHNDDKFASSGNGAYEVFFQIKGWDL